MRKYFIVLSVIALVGVQSSNVCSQGKGQDPLRTAVIETRLVRDSAGCPTAIDMWLVSTTDTIQGFEVVLQWDRPGQVQFVRGTSLTPKPVTAADSMTALLKPSDPKTQMPIDLGNSLLSGWEFVEARSVDGLSAKVLGVAKLFGQSEPEPVLPGATGSLMRIPFAALGTASDSMDVVLNFDSGNTRLSTARGVLFGPLTLKSLKVDPLDCRKHTGK